MNSLKPIRSEHDLSITFKLNERTAADQERAISISSASRSEHTSWVGRIGSWLSLVVKGYCEVAGLYFEETFAPVVRIEPVRVLFVIATGLDLYIWETVKRNCDHSLHHKRSPRHVTRTARFRPDMGKSSGLNIYSVLQKQVLYRSFILGSLFLSPHERTAELQELWINADR